MRAQVDALAGLPIEYVLGEHPLALLDGCDLLLLSGLVGLFRIRWRATAAQVA